MSLVAPRAFDSKSAVFSLSAENLTSLMYALSR